MTDTDSHSVVVVAHPDPESLSHHLAGELVVALSEHGTAVLADLAGEGFDPRWTMADRLAYQGRGDAPADVIAEQRRLDRATDLILVFPVYWWSLPALLKGWIDRVFVNGWAFGYSPAGAIEPRLQRLTTHIVPVAASDAGVYERHRYEAALRTQIGHGVVDFCGGAAGAFTFLHESEDRSAALRHLGRVVDEVIASVTERKSQPRRSRPAGSCRDDPEYA